MSDFVSLDYQHKRSVICHIKMFRTAVEQLSEYVPDRKRKSVLDEVLQETEDFVNFLSNEEVDEIIAQIENSVGEINGYKLS